MSYPILILLRARLAVEELGPPLVEVDELLRVLPPLGLILNVASASFHERHALPVLTVLRSDSGDQPRRTYTTFHARNESAAENLSWRHVGLTEIVRVAHARVHALACQHPGKSPQEASRKRSPTRTSLRRMCVASVTRDKRALIERVPLRNALTDYASSFTNPARAYTHEWHAPT